MKNPDRRDFFRLSGIVLTGVVLSACGGNPDAEKAKANAVARQTDADTDAKVAETQRYRKETDFLASVWDKSFGSTVFKNKVWEVTKAAAAPVGLFLGGMLVTYAIRREMNKPHIEVSLDGQTRAVTVYGSDNLLREMFCKRKRVTLVHQVGVPFFGLVGDGELTKGYNGQGLSDEERRLIIQGDIDIRRVEAGTPKNVQQLYIVPKDNIADMKSIVPGNYTDVTPRTGR